jgi:GntR family transcriptional regulator
VFTHPTRSYDAAIASHPDSGRQTGEGAHGRPLTERARDVLLRAITSGSFPGGRLPPEADLAEELAVSRTTLRAALQSLAADGLISRRRRHGTFVNSHLLRTSMRLNRLVPFTALIEQCGYEPSVDQLGHHVLPAVAEDAEAIGIEPGTQCLVVDRLLRASGSPVITVADIVPLDKLVVGPDAVRDASTTFEFLEANGVASVDYATSEFVPRMATNRRPEGLTLEPGTPYIELVETHFSLDHEPIALSRVCVDDSLVRFSLLRRSL